MLFEPSVWGPHYWFFLHTIAESYPENPNKVLQRKYYDLMQICRSSYPTVKLEINLVAYWINIQ